MSLLEPHMLLHLVVRWLDLAALVLLAGGLAFDALVVTPALDRVALSPTERAAVIACYRKRHTRLVGWSLAGLLLIQFVDLVLRIQMMSGKPVSAVWALLPAVIVGTHIGKVWLAKIGVLVFLSAAWGLASRRPQMEGRANTWHRPALVGSAGLFCLTVALAGHAADQGNLSAAVAADWFHVMAVSAWVGGLVSLSVLVPSMIGALDDKQAARLFTRVMARFSGLAGWSLGLLLITGAYGVWLHIHSWGGLTSTYGMALVTKLALVAPMIGLGALGRYHVLPELQRSIGESSRSGVLDRTGARAIAGARRLLRAGASRVEAGTLATVRSQGLRFILFECVLAAGVLAATSVLTQTMPPHVTAFDAPDAAADGMGDMPGHSMK